MNNSINVSFKGTLQEFKNGKALPTRTLLPKEDIEVFDQLAQIYKNAVELKDLKKKGILCKTSISELILKDGSTVKISSKEKLLRDAPFTVEKSTGEKFTYKLNLRDHFNYDILKAIYNYTLAGRKFFDEIISKSNNFSEKQNNLISEKQKDRTEIIRRLERIFKRQEEREAKNNKTKTPQVDSPTEMIENPRLDSHYSLLEKLKDN